MTTLNEKWKTFEKVCIPESAGSDQRREMKRAFFAGCATAIGICTGEITALSDHEGAQAIESLIQQVRGFQEAIKLGAA